MKELSKKRIISIIVGAILGIAGVILIETGTFNILDLLLQNHTIYYFWANILQTAANNVLGHATFLHPNWWKVLLAIVAYLIIGFLIVEKLLFNYSSLHEDIDDEITLPMVWLIYYFAASGIFLAIFPDHGMAKIHSYLLLAGFLYLYTALSWPSNAFLGLVMSILWSILALIIYLFCFSIFWIGLILFVIALFKNIQVIGGVVASSSSSYHKEAGDLEERRQRMMQEPENFDENDATNLRNDINTHNSRGDNLLG